MEVTVANTGSYRADEVVQLYISDLQASVTVPKYALKGFQRITLSAGTSQSVKFEITPEMMALVNGSGERLVEPGRFRVFLGGSLPSGRSLELGAAPFLQGDFEVK